MIELDTRRNMVLNAGQMAAAFLFLSFAAHALLGLYWTPVPESLGAVVSLAVLVGLAFLRE